MTRRRWSLRTVLRQPGPRAAPRTVTVEFLGLPASGKSTVARLLLALLRAEGFVACNMTGGPEDFTVSSPSSTAAEHRPKRSVVPRANIAHKVQLAYRHRFLMATTAGVLARSSRGAQHRLFTIRRMLTTLGRWESVTHGSQRHDIAVFEEGLLQHAFLVFIDDRGRWDPRRLSRYLSVAVHADLVVHLTLPPAESLRRQLRRADSGSAEPVCISRRFRSLDGASLEAVLSSGAELLRAIVRRVNLDGVRQVLSLEATKPPDALAEALGETVRIMLTQRDWNRDG